MLDPIEILAQVERLTGSHALRESESLRKFLMYLAKQALNHPGEAIKEYQIATEVLGRQQDFDPQISSLVRVQAGRLRTKLAEYYSTEGANDPILIDFPKGTYALNFRAREPHSTVTGAAGSAHEASAEHSHGRGHETRRENGWKTVSAVLATVLFLALAAAGYLALHRPVQAGAPAPLTEVAPEPIRIFWRGFLTGPDKPWVVFSNAAFVGHPDSGMRYYVAQRDHQAHILDHYTGVGEVLAVHALDGVFRQLNLELRVKRGSLFSLDDAKNNDLIFIGSPSENLTLLEIPGTQEFLFRRVPDGSRAGDTEIINAHPSAGEPKVFLASPSNEPLTEDYSVIALLRGLNPSRAALILAGTTTIGTQAAVEFVCRKDELNQLLKRLSVSNPSELKPFEAVIRTRVSHGVPVESTIVSFRTTK